ncbi:DsrE family protein [Halorientalis brevis]|uniref:DsrE family protein n=1 Tax=Halorientalis brevis TaxID=1126241 RepID=A0ABD6CAV6_9EURY|nr:DsrE family protein [Halorientalis brevis]
MDVVVHLISGIGGEQDTSFAIVENLLDADADIDELVVVAQSQGIEAVTAGGETEHKVRSLLDAGVSFVACRNTLDTMDLDESDLVDGVDVVPEGAVEVIRLQTEGYAYLRP